MAAEEKFLDAIDESPAPVVEPAAKAEEKPVAETKPQAEPVDKPDPANSPARPDGYVPRQALEEARREAKEHRDRATLLEDRTNKILERYFSQNQPAKEEPPPIPTWMEDPLAAGEYLAKEVQGLKAQLTQNQQLSQQETAVQSLIQANVTDLTDYAKSNPEVGPATDFLWEWGLEQLRAKNPNADEWTVKQSMNRWQADITHQARQLGVRPARLMHMMAYDRGFQAQAADTGKPAVEVPAGSETKRDPATGQFVSETEKAAKLKTSQERNGSLSSAPGTPVEKMTAKELASLSEDEMWRRFDSVKNSKGKKDFDRRMNFN
jgi:hypothetical protein